MASIPGVTDVETTPEPSETMDKKQKNLKTETRAEPSNPDDFVEKRHKNKRKMIVTTAEPSETGLAYPDDKPKEQHKQKKRKKLKKVDYSSAKWSSSSSEPEYEGICEPMQVCARNLPDDVTEAELMDFFKVQRHQVHIRHLGKNNTLSVIVFGSVSETREALKLCGNPLRGIAIYVKPNGNSRDIVCASGFSNQLTVKYIKKQLRKKFMSRGKVLHIFVPGNSETGCCLGFGYVYVDTQGMDVDLFQSFEIDGLQIDVRTAKPKLCFQSEIVGKKTVLKKENEEDEKTTFKKILLPLNTNLQTLMHTQESLSWEKMRPDIIPEQYAQTIHDCWAIGLQRGYTAMKKLSGKPGRDLTANDLVKGVDAAHLASGEGINRIRNASSFMGNYVKKMKIHRRPRGDDAADFEGFESFIKKLLAVAPVTVTVECVPGFVSFDGEGIYRPIDMDCHLRNFEKFPIHCLLLMEYDVKDGIEYWKLLDSAGPTWGMGGFIMMEWHKCLIKSVIEFEL